MSNDSSWFGADLCTNCIIWKDTSLLDHTKQLHLKYKLNTCSMRVLSFAYTVWPGTWPGMLLRLPMNQEWTKLHFAKDIADFNKQKGKLTFAMSFCPSSSSFQWRINENVQLAAETFEYNQYNPL